MKYCFISINNFGLGFSGGDRIFTELMKGWKKHVSLLLLGSEEAIIISKRNHVDVQFLQASELNPNPQSGMMGLLKHTYQRLKAGVESLTKFEQELKDVDVVYSTSDFYPDFYPAYLMKRRNPKITWIAGYYLFAPLPWAKVTPYSGRQRLRGLIYWLMQRPSYYLINKYADKVFVTSEPDVKYFVNARRSRENVIVVQGGVDVTASEEWLSQRAEVGGQRSEEKKYEACFIGRFHYQKGVLLLIDIWKKVCERKPDAKLAMIGNGPLEEEARAKIKALGLDNNIELLGFMDGEKKFDVFKQSKIMVHPATYDSGGMAAAEGMAWRLPGVSFDLEALKTYYPQGMVKILCFDEQQFADTILRLLNEPAFYEEQASLAHELVLNVWDWDKRAENVWKALNLSEG
jgi:glycosyltransferase involved in cell wall biosynthesis